MDTECRSWRQDARALEGEPPKGFIVVIGFDSAEEKRGEWYDSPDYAAIRPFRQSLELRAAYLSDRRASPRNDIALTPGLSATSEAIQRRWGFSRVSQSKGCASKDLKPRLWKTLGGK